VTSDVRRASSPEASDVCASGAYSSGAKTVPHAASIAPIVARRDMRTARPAVPFAQFEDGTYPIAPDHRIIHFARPPSLSARRPAHCFWRRWLLSMGGLLAFQHRDFIESTRARRRRSRFRHR
jgi:hypothetical protein